MMKLKFRFKLRKLLIFHSDFNYASPYTFMQQECINIFIHAYKITYKISKKVLFIFLEFINLHLFFVLDFYIFKPKTCSWNMSPFKVMLLLRGIS